MNGRCETCEHWSRTKRLEFKQRACLSVIDGGYEWGDDAAPTNEELETLPDDAAFVDVYDERPNELMTGPLFGCIHWTEDTRPT